MNNTSLVNTGSRDTWQAARDLGIERVAGLPAWVVLTQLFIGFGWLRAVAEKVISPQWWTGSVIEDFVVANQDSALGWYQPFLDGVVVPAAPLIALIVVVSQLVAGLSLASGRRLGLGLGLGMFLNLQFLAAGAVTPSAFYLLAQGALALWMAEQAPTFITMKRLGLAAAGAMFLAGLSIPFVSTVHPAHVIDDPAIMFVFGGTLATLACVLAKEPSSDGSRSSN
ncbi:MAG: hypothetical protein ACN4GZ_06595 [Acidimicrobiales bacterium]